MVLRTLKDFTLSMLYTELGKARSTTWYCDLWARVLADFILQEGFVLLQFPVAAHSRLCDPSVPHCLEG